MYPDIWGPAAWHFIFCTLEECPNPVPQEYKDFLGSLKNVLPCAKCRTHYSEYLSSNPLPDDSTELKRYYWKLRDHIAENK